jgi:hypothetical protein
MKSIFTFVWGVAVGASLWSVPPEPSVPDETNIPIVSASGIEVRIVGAEAERWVEEVFPVVTPREDCED